MNKQLANSCTSHPDYDEFSAIMQVKATAEATLKAINDSFDELDDSRCIDSLNMTITLAGQSTAFVFGAPQYNALMQFVDSLLEETL